MLAEADRRKLTRSVKWGVMSGASCTGRASAVHGMSGMAHSKSETLEHLKSRLGAGLVVRVERLSQHVHDRGNKTLEGALQGRC